MKNKPISIYSQTGRFARITLEFITQNKTERIRKSLSVAEKLLTSGSAPVRNAISNIFLPFLSNFLETHYEQGKKIIQLFPPKLRAEYDRQVYSLGV